MKLSNKHTGEVIDLDIADIKAQFGGISVIPEPVKLGGDEYVYHSLAELNDEWEDYSPKEPLIKDAGAREVVRLWAKVNRIPTNATTIEYQYVESLCGTESEFWDNNLHIMFYGKIAPNAIHGKIYTIEELCGEE